MVEIFVGYHPLGESQDDIETVPYGGGEWEDDIETVAFIDPSDLKPPKVCTRAALRSSACRAGGGTNSPRIGRRGGLRIELKCQI